MPDPKTPFIGILMLDTAFPRIEGDAGNVASYPFPTRTRIVAGAGSLDIVQSGAPSPKLRAAFCDAAQALEHEGAVGLISTCGFLVHTQAQIAASVKIPVLVSALSLYPTVRLAVGAAPIAVLTASEAALMHGGLASAGIDTNDVEVVGLDDCTAFTQAILVDKSDQPSSLDTLAIEAAVVEKSRAILERNPQTRAILLECGNLPPYAAAIRAETGLPVFSILDAAALLWASSQS